MITVWYNQPSRSGRGWLSGDRRFADEAELGAWLLAQAGSPILITAIERRV